VTASPFVLDSFTEGADRELSLHAPETGDAWQKHPSYSPNATILSAEGRVRGGSSTVTSRYVNLATPPSTDYEVRATCRVTTTSSNNRTGVLARYSSSTDTGYALWSDRSTWYLARNNGGTQTTLATYSHTLSTNTNYAVRLIVSGSLIECYVDGALVILHEDDSPIVDAGYAGISVRTDSRVDNLEVIAGDSDALLSQSAVEALILQHATSEWHQSTAEVMLRDSGATTTPVSGEIAGSLTGTADISLGAPLSGAISAPISATANLDNGATLIAAGRIEATPRARLAGAAAPVANTGNFFLLF